MNELHQFAYWSTVGFVVFGGLLGIGGIWIPASETGRKLFATDCVLAVTSLIVALLTKWLA